METCQVKGWWRDPGQLSDIIEANRLVMDRKSLFQVETAKIRNSKLIGKIGIGRKSKITNSVIHGPVLIGDGVEVTDSYIGPYTSVYHNCVIRGSKLANSVVMEQTTIENVKKKIDQSFIGKEVKISGRLKNHHLIISDLSEVHL